MVNVDVSVTRRKMIILNEGKEVAPCIFVYDNVIDNSEQLIKLAHSYDDSKKSGAKIFNLNGEHYDASTRNTTSINIEPTYKNDLEWFVVAKKIWEYGDRYAKEQDICFSFMEYPQFLHYSSGEGFYKPHSDAGPGVDRVFSAVLYLNEVENGGETYFNNLDISVSPKGGRLVLFPANYAYKHEARIPVTGEKNVIVTWFRN